MNDLRAILPQPTTATEAFWAACDEGRLMMTRCAACGHLFHFPRPFCIQCGSDDVALETVSGLGSIFSLTSVAMSFYGSTWQDQVPYTVILVDLDEGPRMASRLVGPDHGDASIGDRVRVIFPEIDGQRLPFFERVAQSEPGA